MILNEHNFQAEVLQADPNEVVLVDVWATWCPPCRKLGQILDQMTPVPNTKIGKINLDENMEFCNKFGVNALPTMIFFKGGQVKKTIVGLETEKTIRKTLEDLLKSA